MTDTLDALITKITGADANNFRLVSATLSAFLKQDDAENILRGTIQTGQDPLRVLSPSTTTLAYLYILSSRLSASGNGGVHPSYIAEFCQSFDPTAARFAPERITKLARLIVKYSESIRNPPFAILPLYHLVSRYPPSPAYLTTIHPIFLLSCITGTHLSAALPILSTPISQIDLLLSDLDYNDNLQYHYLGGVIFGALKRYEEAEDFLETAVSSPAHSPSAIQLEAYKKLILIQLIRHGKTIPPPKYTNTALTKQMKAIPQYAAIVRHYPTLKGPLQEVLAKEINFFREEGNFGLLTVAINHARRWALKNLNKTYLSLSLHQVASYIGFSNEDEARELVLSMVEDGTLSATLSPDGTLTFLEETLDSSAFAPEAVESMLRQAQDSGELLTELNMSIMKSRELLTKALKEKEASSGYAAAGSPGYDEEPDIWTGGRSGRRVDGLFDD
ncbi:hypothetical protein BS47DRAFT_1375491 [Hydnum rufescens UP504]|uniref:COP9 signalosome complex subunit 3 n=1 Tax=Hydnum rufescens UP504 TaxID=1448309 RepID=A0A9P6B5F7_9AGAM|nr:hypothetical protein BS47DRAFT_1375491 [Hydnum rufescens UP504]